MFYTVECSLDDLRAESRNTSIVLTPCALADEMTAAYIAVGVFETPSSENDQQYALELARECLCVVTLNVSYNAARESRYRLIYTVSKTSVFAKYHKACGLCGKSDVDLMMCAQCKSVFYCSKECQKQDWRSSHKKYCETKESLVAEERPSILFTNNKDTVAEYERSGGTVIDFDQM
jgi:hypothetical protein